MGGMNPNCQPYSTQQFFSIFFSQYCPEIFENKSYPQIIDRFSTGVPRNYFHFFLWESLLLFSFFIQICPRISFFYFYSDLPRKIGRTIPLSLTNSSISNQFLTTFHLSLGFMICYNIVVPRERKKPCAVRLEPIGPKFRALVYIW